MKVIWLIPPFVTPDASRENPEQALVTSPRASVRLRMAVAALEWKRRGHENVYGDPAAGAGRGFDWESADICVVSKIDTDVPLEPWLDACATARRKGCRLVIDFCDYPFRRKLATQNFYTEVLKICDAVVVNSERMAEMIAPHANQQPAVIEDAILGVMRKPEFAPGKRLELLWFGYPINLPYLEARFEDLRRFAQHRRCRLTVVTQGEVVGEKWAQEVQARFGFEAQFVSWSLEALRIALRKCDLVLIPSDPSDTLKAGASANRIAEVLHAGRFPVASPLQSYLQFAEAAWLGQDLFEGVGWALANRGDVLARIRRGQALLAERFAADRVGRQWCELFERLAGARGR